MSELNRLRVRKFSVSYGFPVDWEYGLVELTASVEAHGRYTKAYSIPVDESSYVLIGATKNSGQVEIEFYVENDGVITIPLEDFRRLIKKFDDRIIDVFDAPAGDACDQKE